jgi:hypothetical protein
VSVEHGVTVPVAELDRDPYAHKIPSKCPCCGFHSLAPDVETATLIAVCNTLVLKALEKAGNYIVRADRSRHRVFGSRPKYEAHTVWPVTDAIIEKALSGAWDVVPVLLDLHGCCGVTAVQVTDMLSQYIHDLSITGTLHTLDELEYRFEVVLGFPIKREVMV